ncbi:hypothetical protein J6590_038994 [Homalodisca vitripennis]|nr:hypothetical protein J6590_038994 [Homalodisca vitripennis]
MSSSSLFELLSPSSNQGTFLVNALSHHEPLAMLPASTKPTDRAETMSQYLTDIGGGVNCTSVTRNLSRDVRAKKPSLTLNLGTNGLMVTSEPPPMAGQAAPCKDRIAQQSPVQAAATLGVA